MFYMYKNPSGEVKMDFSNIVKTWTKGDHNKKYANTTSLAQSASIEQTVESKIEVRYCIQIDLVKIAF